MAIDFNVLRSRLGDERKRLTEELERLEIGHSGDERREGSPFGKREEEATEAMELEKRLVLEQGMKEQLVKIERALQKFEQGTYGLCDKCGQPIVSERLEALPYASLCVGCKAKQENAKAA
ncbi:TraR/DksA family transcriptional regulator [Chloroflexota bacterium]